jgi:hypothetical protein
MLIQASKFCSVYKLANVRWVQEHLSERRVRLLEHQ